MKTAVLILSLFCGVLLIKFSFLAYKTEEQKKEIRILENKVDSLEFKIFLDSIPIRVDNIFKKHLSNK